MQKFKMPYQMSIETTHGSSEKNGFHLGTDECVAKMECEDRFHGRVKLGLPTVTIALMDSAGRVVDGFDGSIWASDLVNDWGDTD